MIEQHWRQDEDGTFIVLAHSVRHHGAREAPRSRWSWFHPVRAQVAHPALSSRPPSDHPAILLGSAVNSATQAGQVGAPVLHNLCDVSGW